MTIRNRGYASGLIAALAVFGTAQAQAPETSGSAASRDAASSRHAASGEQKIDRKLEERLQKIHASNQAELHMAKLGQQQARSPEVKEYAQQLEQDHQKLDQELQQTAQSAGVQLEGEAFQKQQKDAMKDMDKLTKKSGQDFDKEFVSHMVKDHKKDLDAVKDASKQAKKDKHAELASTLDQAQTTLQGHLDRAKSLESSLKSSGQQRQGRRGTTPGGN